MADPDDDLDLSTIAVHGAHGPDPGTGAVAPPIHPSTTFARGPDHELLGPYGYRRDSSPTVEQVETLAAKLDNAAAAMAFGSGMAGVAAVIETVPTGGHVVAPEVMYHGTIDWLRRRDAAGAIRLELVPAGSLLEALRPGETKLVWTETPVNPTWQIVDIAATAAAVHAAGAILAVDGTAAPPVTTRALDLGADLVFHSATKYYNGHSDVLAGIVATKRIDERWEELHEVRRLSGGVLGAFDAWLLVRGMRTLPLRFERASENAMAIAHHLTASPGVQQVLYPGLETHPGHEIARRQMVGGFGGMLSLLIDGDAAATTRVAVATRVFRTATSLGGVESLIEHRAMVEGPGTKVPDNLLRLSVGIEAVGDLIDDLDRALEHAGRL